MKKLSVLSLSLLLLVTVTVGGTLAFLVTKTDNVVNEFEPTEVKCAVIENFDGKTKSEVNVQNTGTAAAYIRVKLVSYRVNGAGQTIGGSAIVPEFAPGEGWVEKDGFYYYTSPVAPGGQPAANLIDSIALQAYTDVDGGRQVIEVLAEAIQAEGGSEIEGKFVPAVTQSWGVDPTTLQ